MNLLYRIYKGVGLFVVIALFPAFFIYSLVTGKYRDHLAERLGLFPERVKGGPCPFPRIWIHAVSLGEIKVARAVVDALDSSLGASRILVSTTTEHGRDLALDLLGERCDVVYAPVDLSLFVRRALCAVRPQVMVFMETEIWPAWIFESYYMGVKIAFLNGRISMGSFGTYLKLRPFLRLFLKKVDAFSMISEADAGRIAALGAEAEKIRISGNAKYDFLASDPDPEIEEKTRAALNIDSFRPVFVAGSTRRGEERMLFEAHERILREIPDFLLIIVPRHIDRKEEICSLAENRGFGYRLWTELGGDGLEITDKVLIVDAFGELFRLYSVATIAFCGGSLVPLGGQNPLEPAAWGKVVFYGPSMENFSDSKELLEAAGVGMEVTDARMLANKVLWFLYRPEELKYAGEKGPVAIKSNLGAAKRHADVIVGLLDQA